MKPILGLLLAAPCLAACGGSYPAPTQHMADAMSAERSAREVGATKDPRGQLHLKLASEELTRAKALMADGDYRRADFVIIRAKSDAELALALARAQNARAEAVDAVGKATALHNQNERERQSQDIDGNEAPDERGNQ